MALKSPICKPYASPPSRYSKLSEASARGGPSPSSLVSPDPLAAAPAATGLSSEGGDGAPTELHIYTDFLRIVLEIMNAILTYALPRNPEVRQRDRWV